jgi:hypothetical protein
LIYRTYTTGGTVSRDSFFYDGSDRIIRVVKYDNLGAKDRTTVFTFNGDNTHNSATVDYESGLMSDELFDFVYVGGQLRERSKSLMELGTYRLKTKLEYLAYDDKTNPFASVYNSVLMDIIEAFPFYSAYPNNTTSVKQTEYDLLTGNPTGITSISLTYTYNEDNLPVMFSVTDGSATNVYELQYAEY